MSYDPGLRVYVVESHPDVYFASGFYFQESNQGWERSRHADGPWARCSERQLPPGLRKPHKDDHHDEGRHEHHGHD